MVIDQIFPKTVKLQSWQHPLAACCDLLFSCSIATHSLVGWSFVGELENVDAQLSLTWRHWFIHISHGLLKIEKREDTNTVQISEKAKQSKVCNVAFPLHHDGNENKLLVSHSRTKYFNTFESFASCLKSSFEVTNKDLCDCRN